MGETLHAIVEEFCPSRPMVSGEMTVAFWNDIAEFRFGKDYGMMIMLSQAQEDGDVAGGIPRYEATGQLEVSSRVSTLADRGTGHEWQWALLDDLKRVYAAHCKADPDGARAVMSALLAACDEYVRTRGQTELRVLFYRM